MNSLMNTPGAVFNVQRFALHDGPGIRTTVFLQGCPLRCQWCHNPESQPFAADGEAAPYSPHPWRRVTVADILAEVQRDTLFYDESGGGVTFSGGEPLCQPDFLCALLAACRARSIHTAVDTCGLAAPAVLERAAEYTDLFLYDIKLIDDTRHIAHTGVSNRAILANFRLLLEWKKPVLLRFPVIPGITDTADNLDAVLELLSGGPALRGVTLLPYHAYAGEKYRRLGREYPLAHLKPPAPERMQELSDRFRRAGLAVNP